MWGKAIEIDDATSLTAKMRTIQRDGGKNSVIEAGSRPDVRNAAVARSSMTVLTNNMHQHQRDDLAVVEAMHGRLLKKL